MNTRLLKIIDYKTNGHQKAFAELMGWSPPYLAKLLRGNCFGLQPVLSILARLPEINARWLLLGDGEMLSDQRISELQRDTLSRAQMMLDIERCIPVMSPTQLKRYETALATNQQPDFSSDEIAQWQKQLNNREETMQQRFADALVKATH